MKEKGMIRKWLCQFTEEEQKKQAENLFYISYPYEKYGEVVFAFKTDGENGMNAQIYNLSGELITDNSYVGYKETLPFVEHLGKRMELALNYFNGISNEDIKKLLDNKRKEAVND